MDKEFPNKKANDRLTSLRAIWQLYCKYQLFVNCGCQLLALLADVSRAEPFDAFTQFHVSLPTPT